jgi:hypothetical protein
VKVATGRRVLPTRWFFAFSSLREQGGLSSAVLPKLFWDLPRVFFPLDVRGTLARSSRLSGERFRADGTPADLQPLSVLVPSRWLPIASYLAKWADGSYRF